MTLPPAGHGYRPQASGKVNPQPPQGGAGVVSPETARANEAVVDSVVAWRRVRELEADVERYKELLQAANTKLARIDTLTISPLPVSVRDLRDALR